MNNKNNIKGGANVIEGLTSHMVDSQKKIKVVYEMNITKNKTMVEYNDKLKNIEGKFKAYYIQANDSDSLTKLTALCKANETLKTELATLLKELAYIDASKIQDKSIKGLKDNSKIKAFMKNYLEVSKKYYKLDSFKNHLKALFSYSKNKKQVYLKPAFLFLLGLKKNPIHYLQISFGLTATTSPKELAKFKTTKKNNGGEIITKK